MAGAEIRCGRVRTLVEDWVFNVLPNMETKADMWMFRCFAEHWLSLAKL